MKSTWALKTSLILMRLNLECCSYNFNKLTRSGTINVSEIFKAQITKTTLTLMSFALIEQ